MRDQKKEDREKSASSWWTIRLFLFCALHAFWTSGPQCLCAISTDQTKEATTPKPPPREKRIFSIGHSNHSIKEFLEILQNHGVKSIGDVRDSPTCWRHKQFNREELAESCRKSGITYRHFVELGNKSTPIRKLIETEEGQAALDQLAEAYENSEKGATAIMASEKESRKCHRYLVSQRLLEDFGVNVTHIRYDGSTYMLEEPPERLSKTEVYKIKQ